MPLCSLLQNVLGKYWVTSELTSGCLIENEVTITVTLFLVEPHPSYLDCPTPPLTVLFFSSAPIVHFYNDRRYCLAPKLFFK